MNRPDPLSLRIPDQLKSRLMAAANEAGRSLNAEIRMRLEASFDAGFSGAPSDQMLANEIESLRGELRGALSEFGSQLNAVTQRLQKLENDQ